jgi:hypothetical protein
LYLFYATHHFRLSRSLPLPSLCQVRSSTYISLLGRKRYLTDSMLFTHILTELLINTDCFVDIYTLVCSEVFQI